jgi:hypothetical protein
MPDMPRTLAATEDMPRLRRDVLPRRGWPVGCRVLLDAVLSEDAQAAATPERRSVMARSAWNQARRNLYLTQRTMGDLSAASRGPVPLAKRLARRDLTRMLFRVLRGFGK